MLSRLSRRLPAVLAATIAAALMAACSPAADGPSVEKPDATRSITHARGETSVPAQAQRVVTLEPLELDTAVALGITPVGSAVASNVSQFPAYLGISGVSPVGTVPEPDLEAIAQLKPDLILGTESRHSKLYDQLTKIAPTVFIATQADPWRDNATLIGKALGRESDTTKLLSDVDKRCAEVRSKNQVSGQTAQLIRPRDETTLSLYGPQSFAGSLLECVGFTIPEQKWVDGLQADISPENIRSAAADRLYVTTTDVKDTSTIPAAITADAATFGSVTLVDTSHWVSGVGPKGAQIVLDDIEKSLTTNR